MTDSAAHARGVLGLARHRRWRWRRWRMSGRQRSIWFSHNDDTKTASVRVISVSLDNMLTNGGGERLKNWHPSGNTRELIAIPERHPSRALRSSPRCRQLPVVRSVNENGTRVTRIFEPWGSLDGRPRHSDSQSRILIKRGGNHRAGDTIFNGELAMSSQSDRVYSTQSRSVRSVSYGLPPSTRLSDRCGHT